MYYLMSADRFVLKFAVQKCSIVQFRIARR